MTSSISVKFLSTNSIKTNETITYLDKNYSVTKSRKKVKYELYDKLNVNDKDIVICIENFNETISLILNPSYKYKVITFIDSEMDDIVGIIDSRINEVFNDTIILYRIINSEIKLHENSGVNDIMKAFIYSQKDMRNEYIMFRDCVVPVDTVDAIKFRLWCDDNDVTKFNSKYSKSNWKGYVMLYSSSAMLDHPRKRDIFHNAIDNIENLYILKMKKFNEYEDVSEFVKIKPRDSGNDMYLCVFKSVWKLILGDNAIKIIEDYYESVINSLSICKINDREYIKDKLKFDRGLISEEYRNYEKDEVLKDIMKLLNE